MSLGNELLNKSFSHVYIEKKAEGFPLAAEILQKLPGSRIIYIDSYGDLFFQGRQDFPTQKNSPKLILAKKEEGFFYKGSPMCDNFGYENFYYSSNIMNCFYDCEYCYLQGMYPSANCVVFVNIEDYFLHARELLKKHPLYLCVSYDTDLMAFERIAPLTGKWINFARQNPGLTLEIRTKSANFNALLPLEPLDNVIFAWTLSPEEIICRYEHKTPSLDLRIKSAAKAIAMGFNVRLCFDPVIHVRGWERIYESFIGRVFSETDPALVFGVSIGPFRLPADYLTKMRKQRPLSPVLLYPYEIKENTAGYPKEVWDKMLSRVYGFTLSYVDKSRIFLFS